MSFMTSTTVPGNPDNSSDPQYPRPPATLPDVVALVLGADALASWELNNPHSKERESCPVVLVDALAMRAVGISGSVPMYPKAVIREIKERNLRMSNVLAAFNELCLLLYRRARARDDAGARLPVAEIMGILRRRLGCWAHYLSAEEMGRLEGEVRDAEVALTCARA